MAGLTIGSAALAFLLLGAAARCSLVLLPLVLRRKRLQPS